MLYNLNSHTIHMSIDKQKKIMGLLLILPTFLIMIGLSFYPLFLNFVLAFSTISLPSFSMHFNGFDNYIKLFQDPLFIKALINSSIWVIGTVPIQLLLGLSTALILNQKLKGKPFFNTIAIIPWSVSPVVSAVIWSWLYHPNFGWINIILTRLGLLGFTNNWLSNPGTVLPAIMLAYIWAGTPVSTFVLLGALLSIPSSLYDAAEVDGANKFQIFKYIILPHLTSIIVTLILILIFFSINSSMSYVYPMTGGGPGNTTMVMDLYIRNIMVDSLKFNIGAAASCFLLFITVIIAVITIYLQRLKENREA